MMSEDRTAGATSSTQPCNMTIVGISAHRSYQKCNGGNDFQNRYVFKLKVRKDGAGGGGVVGDESSSSLGQGQFVEWELDKSYPDFVQLWDDLRAASDATLPDLPTVFTIFMRKDDNYRQGRLFTLTECLKTVLKLFPHAQFTCLRKFFGLNKPPQTSLLTGHAAAVPPPRSSAEVTCCPGFYGLPPAESSTSSFPGLYSPASTRAGQGRRPSLGMSHRNVVFRPIVIRKVLSFLSVDEILPLAPVSTAFYKATWGCKKSVLKTVGISGGASVDRRTPGLLNFLSRSGSSLECVAMDLRIFNHRSCVAVPRILPMSRLVQINLRGNIDAYFFYLDVLSALPMAGCRPRALSIEGPIDCRLAHTGCLQAWADCLQDLRLEKIRSQNIFEFKIVFKDIQNVFKLQIL